MAPETGFETTSSSPGPWTSASPVGGVIGSAAAVGSAFMPWAGLGGTAAGGGTPWLDPSTALGGTWADGSAHQPGKATTVDPDKQSIPAVKDAIHGAMGGKAKQDGGGQAILTPEQLDTQFKSGKGEDYTRATALGLSADQYKQQYLHEYMARLSQNDPFAKGPDGKPMLDDKGQPKSNYSAAQKNSLSAWGYNSKIDPTNVVDDNKNSGLFAIRFEPTAAGEKSGRAPVVAMRGTEPDRGPKDLQADLADEYIGKSQYEPNKAAIASLFGRKPGEKDDLVGYSLGGSLAQRALLDNASSVRALTTFQSPGIKGSDAQAVNAAIKNNGIEANHHFFTNDIVHRAGEAKANGNYHEYTRGDWATGLDTMTAHTSSFLIPSDGGSGTIDGHGNVRTDQYQNATGSNTPTTIQNYQNDRQKDRGFWEQQRRTLGPAAGGLLGEVQPAMNLWQKTDSEFNPVLGPDGKPIPGALQNSVNQVKNGWNGAKNGVGEVGQGLGEVGHGFGDLFSGNIFKGGLEIGKGVLDSIRGVKDTGGGIGNMWNGAKSGISTLGNFWHDHVAPHGGDLKALLSGAPEILAHLAHDPSVQKRLGPDGGPIAEGLATAYDQAKPLVKKTTAGLGSAGNEIGNGFGEVKGGLGDAKHGVSEAGHGFSDILHGKFGQGAAEIFGGAKHTLGGLRASVGGVQDMWGGAKHGASTLKGAWTGAKQIWNEDIASNADHYKALAGQAIKPFTQPISNAVHKVQDIGHGISNGFHSAVDTTKHVAQDVGNTVANGFHSAVDTTKHVAQNVGNTVSNGFHSAVDGTKHMAQSFGNGVSSLAGKAKKLWPF